MTTNAFKVFGTWIAIFLLIARVLTFFDLSFQYNTLTPYGYSISEPVHHMEETQVHYDQSNPETFTIPISIVSTPVFYQSPFLKYFFLYLVLSQVVAYCLILMEQHFFFGRCSYSFQFLPYFLLQLQIVHKFDGKYR